mgnify:FL=1
MKNIKVNIDNLNRDLYLMVVEEPQILNELLVLEGYDPSQLERNVVSQVKKLLFQQTVAIKKAHRDDIYKKALILFQQTKETTKHGILAILQERSPQLQFNNLDKMDEQDLRDILNETDLLDLMEKIEKNEI